MLGLIVGNIKGKTTPDINFLSNKPGIISVSDAGLTVWKVALW